MIVTFYSYKGGVGRTQLLSNLAAYLCHLKGKKILLMEWDLEAPGLHYYFGKHRMNLYEGLEIPTKGLIELLQEYVEIVSDGITQEEKEQISKIDESNILKLIKSEENEGCIDLVPAGIYDKDYNRKVNAFNWDSFYNNLGGADYIEELKTCLHSLDYDYVFIDSRTGISDYSGICNIQLADMNVLVTIPNMQSFEGIYHISQSIIKSPYTLHGMREPIILPVFSRVDTTADNWHEWIKRFRKHFAFLIYNLFIPKKLEFSFIEMVRNNRASDDLEKYYEKDNGNYALKKDLTDQDKEEILKILQIKSVAYNYLSETLLDYNKSVVHGEVLLFDKNMNTEADILQFVSLARNYRNIAEYIERIAEAELIDFSKVIRNIVYQVGSKVLASWSGDRYWYAATIMGVKSDKYDILYFKGNREWRTYEQIHPLDIEIGERVKYRKSDSYSFTNWAKIKNINGEKLIVEDEENKQEEEIKLRDFRVNR